MTMPRALDVFVSQVWTAERHEYDLRFDAIPARAEAWKQWDGRVCQ